MQKKNSFLSVSFVIILILFIFSFSIALPILFRPFYYAHIDAYDLTEFSNYNKSQIKEAYNEVLDYLIFPGGEFSCGELKYSEEGKAHFEDCKILFMLNNGVLLVSSLSLTTIFILRKKKKIPPLTIKNRPAAFYAGVYSLILPLIAALFICIDFEAAFTLFHKIVFPGKENWAFYPHLDHIINVLPWQFFRNCAILIGVSIISLSLFSIFYKSKNPKE